MVHTLHIAVGIIAGLQSVVAQEAPKNPFPADNVENVPGYEGHLDYRCHPFGVDTKWNNTWYPPCLLQREYDDKCRAVIPPDATEEESVKIWEKERNCYCVKHKDYFAVVAKGCVDCKGPKGYNLEHQDNVNAYKALFESLSKEGYCEVEGTLKADYASYYKQALEKSGVYNGKANVPKAAFTVPVSEYWNDRPDGYDSKPLPKDATEPANLPAEGTANLPPQVDYAIGIAPVANSTKFAATKGPVNKLFSIVKCTNLTMSIHNGQKTVEPANPPQVFVNPLSAASTVTRMELDSKIQLDGTTVVQCSKPNCADQTTQQPSPEQLTDLADNNGATAPAPVDTNKKTDKHATVNGKKCRRHHA